MINLLALSGLVNFIACVGLAALVWRSRPGDPTAKAYAIFNSTVGFFSFFYFVWQCCRTSENAYLSFQLLVFGIIWINQAYLYFIFTFLGTGKKRQEQLIFWTCGCLNLFFSLLTFSDTLFPSVSPRFNLGFWPNPSPWFTDYLVFWHLQCLYGFWKLVQASQRRNFNPRQTKQLKYLIIAFAIGYFGGANNWPMWYGVHFPPYLNNLIAIYIAIIAYAILNRQFMDIRLVLRDTTLHVTTVTLLAGACMMIGLPLVTMSPNFAVVGSVSAMGLLMAIAYDPIRNALQPAIDRLMFANRFGYLEELSQLPNDMLEFTNLREMLKFLATRLVDAAKLEDVKILMYDPGHQSYIDALHESTQPDTEVQQLAENNPLFHLLARDGRLWTKEEIDHLPLADDRAIGNELSQMHAVACFPVKKQDELLGVVFLGPKKSGEAFNQQDLKILRALQIRLENFLAQAMSITQEALNMVKDSHDMKNDVNAMKGRVTWRAMRSSGWWADFEKELRTAEAVAQALPVQDSSAETLRLALSSIRTSSQLWYDDLKKSVPVEEGTLKRLAHRLKNWAEYGRVISEGFRGHRQKEAVDVAEAARFSVERWRPMAEAKALVLTADVSELLWVWGERSLVEQIVENLIDNAIKATAKGAIDVRARSAGGEIEIEVEDSGCGIPEVDLPSIFERPFYQGKGRENLEQSTGVGLYLVAQYAKSLGGRVSADSRVGEGSTFRVLLPVHRKETTREGVAA